MISVIMVQHGQLALTRRALDSLFSWGRESLDVILVDNASEGFDPHEWESRWNGVRVIGNSVNRGFGAANNSAAKMASGEVLLFLNSDTESHYPFAGHVEKAFAEHPRMGVLGPALMYPDGSFQLSAGSLPGIAQEATDKAIAHFEAQPWFRPWLSRRFSRRRSVGWVSGAALFIRKELFHTLGGFDEGMFMFFEDKDLCRRVWDAGHEVIYDPSISIMHVKGGSSVGSLAERAAAAYRESQRHYYRKHLSPWQNTVLEFYLRRNGV